MEGGGQNAKTNPDTADIFLIYDFPHGGRSILLRNIQAAAILRRSGRFLFMPLLCNRTQLVLSVTVELRIGFFYTYIIFLVYL